MDMNLRNFPELKQLECRNNKLTSTSGINAPVLEKLYLAENNINRVEGLEDKPKLQLIHLRDNKLEKLDGFANANLPSLSYLNLRRNLISDVEELAKLSKMGQLKRLVTAENPIAESETYRLEVLAMLPLLEVLDKEAVTAEEREEALAFAEQLKQRKAEEKAAAEAFRKQEEEEAALALAQAAAEGKDAENEEGVPEDGVDEIADSEAPNNEEEDQESPEAEE